MNLGPRGWAAAELTIGSGTQLTGLDLALEPNRADVPGDYGFGSHDYRKTPSSVVVSLWTATPQGLPGQEIVASPLTVSNHRGCSDRKLTEVDFYTPPTVKAGEKLFIAVGVLGGPTGGERQGGSGLEWCEYSGSTAQTLAFSHNQGSTWVNSNPPAGGSVFAQVGFADYVTSGPPAVTPEAPVATLLPVAGAGAMGGMILLARRRRRRSSEPVVPSTTT